MSNSRTITKIGSTARVRDFLNNTSVWLCIGRTTPWQDEENPPGAGVETVFLDEPILYKRITEMYFVKPVQSNGDYYIEGQWYEILTPSEARMEKTNLLVLAQSLSYQEVEDTVIFRQVGIYSQLIPDPEHQNETILQPSQVSDPGWLEWYANLEPTRIQSGQRINFHTILAF